MPIERDRSVGYLINWAARLFVRLADRRLKPLGMMSGQIPVFTALANNGAMSQKALAQAAAIEQPTMAATLARMERDGLIERRPDPADGRSALVSLTPPALEKVEAVAQLVLAINAEALRAVPEREVELFRVLLRAMISGLETALADEIERP